MRKRPFFALVSDDSAVGASQQVNGIERQKPWLWYDFVTGLLCDIEKVTFHLFSLHPLSVESCVLFGTPSSSSMFISCLFSALGALHFQSSYYSQQPKAPEFLAREREEGGFSST